MPSVAQAASGPSGAPAAKHRASAMAASTMVVPRLGWSMSSVAMAASTTTTGRSVARELRMSAARRASRSATHTSRANLASSAGWNVSEPMPIQRVAPLAPTPTPGTSTRSRKPSDTSRSGVANSRQRW